MFILHALKNEQKILPKLIVFIKKFQNHGYSNRLYAR